MKYYKIILDNSFIGAIHSGLFVTEGQTRRRLFYSDEIRGQYVSYNGILYHDYWMQPVDGSRTFVQAQIIEITENEYNIYIDAINNNEPIEDDDDDDDIPTPIPEPTPEQAADLEFVREAKLLEMSRDCRAAIEVGFDLIIRGETYHFSLTTQDQLNLMNLNLMAQTEQLIPYHADGEECVFYTPEEIREIISAATSFKNYQIAYHNALKVYINTLDNIEDIGAITYGTPIPDEYKSDVLRVLE